MGRIRQRVIRLENLEYIPSDAAVITTVADPTLTNSSVLQNGTGTTVTTGAGTVQVDIADAGVTYAKIQSVSANSVLARASSSSGSVGEVALSATQLLGRGSTGDVAAISLGTGLSMSGTTLSASGGGGSSGGSFGANFNGGLAVISAGTKAVVGPMPYAGTITEANILADTTGSMVCDVRKCTYSTYDSASSICASAKPTLSSAKKSQDTTLTGWTKTFSVGDIFLFVIESASSVKNVAVSIKVTKS